jgi:hypothetical protein
MARGWRRGCVGLLLVMFSTMLLAGVLAGVGLMVGVRQPGQLWAVPVSRGYFAIGRIVSSADCRRLRARGFRCTPQYGAVLYLPYSVSGRHGTEFTLFAFPEPQSYISKQQTGASTQ